jgi:ABC-2 type transport system ATP-binding protein
MNDVVIRARDLTKHYGATVGLEGLDLEVRRGELFGFLGPNGAGKTTTIRLLLDLIRPTRGSASLFGRPVRECGLRGRVGYLPGELALDGRLTGRQTLRFLASLRGPDAARPAAAHRESCCEKLGLAGDDLDRRVRDYSRGMKQKLGLISALEHGPDLLILDEPTTGLDPLVREALFEILLAAGAEGRTVFHSSHVLSEVDRTCGRVAVIRAGRLVAVKSSDEIRRASVRRMVVRFDGPVPAGELALPGIELLEREGGRAVLKVSGKLNPLLAVLARHRVHDLAFPEPSLEEAFDDLYRGGEEDGP